MMANGIYFGINDSIGKSIEIIDNEITHKFKTKINRKIQLFYDI